MLAVEPETIPYGLPRTAFRLLVLIFRTLLLRKQKKKLPKPTLNTISYLLNFSRTKLKELLLVLYLTEAVFTHSVLKMIEEGLHKIPLLIWKKLACG